jgi:hypothetical protein
MRSPARVPAASGGGVAAISRPGMQALVWQLLLSSWCLLATQPAGLIRADEPVSHSFLGVGRANQAVIIGEDGQRQWHYPAPASDGWVLSNGNVLLALYPTADFPGGGVVEVSRENNALVFQYQGRQAEISTAVKRADGTYLIAELGHEPRAIVVDAAGTIQKETPLQCQKENPHMQTRMLRELSSGNYLAPHLLDFAVKEYDPDTGEVLSVLHTDDRGRDRRDWPFTAIRLPNGGTLIGCTNGVLRTTTWVKTSSTTPVAFSDFPTATP